MAAGSEATTSSHIEEMIQELAQQEGLEASTIGMPHEVATVEVGEPSPPSGLSRDLPSTDPQLGKRILTCWILLSLPLTFNVVVCREHWGSSSRGSCGNHWRRRWHSSNFGREPSAVEFAIASVTVEAATTITIPKVSVTTSVSDESIVGLTPAQVELVPVSRPVMERSPGLHQHGYL